MSEMVADFEARRADAAEKKLKSLREQLPALEKRIAALEARKTGGITEADMQKALLKLAPLIRERIDEATEGLMRYRGVFQRADSYARGDSVTVDGALFYCIKTVEGSSGRPGSDEAASFWQLMAKTR